MKFSGVSRFTLCCLLIAGMGGAMSGRHAVQAQDAAAEMSLHMRMTEPWPVQPGDRERADAIAAAARKAAEPYLDYHKALADRYKIIAPDVPQYVYHFVRQDYLIAATFRFDPDKPTSLLYEKTTTDGKPEYKLVGVMYTDRHAASEEELNRRVPLSIAQWHLHTNLCFPPRKEMIRPDAPDAKFWLNGSITTEAACNAAGGQFYPHILGWMVHVYPFETDPAKIWRAGMDDEHGMQHDSMSGMMIGIEMKPEDEK